MSTNLILGWVTTVISLLIQCFVVAILVRALIALKIKGFIRPTPAGITALLVGALVIILAGNVLQMGLWAGLFLACGEFQDFNAAFYHSAVNFSTLGYGDVVMSQERRLLGALEAANGVMMFGLTTSILYAVLSTLVARAWEIHVGHLPGSVDSRNAKTRSGKHTDDTEH
ncbi:MAG: two pore domain potassium channel family protein [Phycisphaerales bacterium]|nr:MAG: two pore domain potassium channel family protein [Phycisphaerales bacterium]